MCHNSTCSALFPPLLRIVQAAVATSTLHAAHLVTSWPHLPLMHRRTLERASSAQIDTSSYASQGQKSPIVVMNADSAQDRRQLSLSLNASAFARKASQCCKHLLSYAHGYTSFRIVCNVQRNNGTSRGMPELIDFALERDPTEWFKKRRELLPATPVDISALANEFGELLDDCIEYEDYNSNTLQRELAAFYDDETGASKSSDTAHGSAILQQKSFCREGLDCARQRPKNHSKIFTHVETCRRTLHGQGNVEEQCGFCVPPMLDVLKITTQRGNDRNDAVAACLRQCGFTLFLRSQPVPELLLAPSVEDCNRPTVLSHNNVALSTDERMWRSIHTIIRTIDDQYEATPMMITINFGKWESAVASNHRAVKLECHGHVHLVFPLSASNTVTFLRKRSVEPDFYRTSNITAMKTATARYESRLNRAQFAKLRESIAEVKERLDDVIAEVKEAVRELGRSQQRNITSAASPESSSAPIKQHKRHKKN